MEDRGWKDPNAIRYPRSSILGESPILKVKSARFSFMDSR